MDYTVDKSLCIACGACFRACPRGIFVPDAEGKMDTRDDTCLRCFHCTAICPTKAVHCAGIPDEELYPETFSDEPLYGLIQKRRSIRNFGPVMPDKEIIRKVLDRAERAASAKNEHPTRWVVIRGKERLDEIYRLTVEWAKRTNNEVMLYSMVTLGRNAVTCNSSCAVVGCCKPKESSMPESDAVIALTQAELMFVEAGWDTCWSGYLRRAIHMEPSVRELAGIPEGYEPYAVLLVGKEQGEHYLRPAYRAPARIDWTE